MKMFIALKNRAARTGLSISFSLGLAVALSVALLSPAARAESLQAAGRHARAWPHRRLLLSEAGFARRVV